MKIQLFSVAVLLGTPALGLAQSFNIDVQGATDPLPLDTYGAYPSVAGTWNLCEAAAFFSAPLVDIDNTPTNSTVTKFTNNGFAGGATVPSPNPEEVKLMGDHAFGFQSSISVDNLDAGDYAIIAYSWRPDTESNFELFFTDGLGNFSSQLGVVDCPPLSQYPGLKPGETLVSWFISNPADGGLLDLVYEGETAKDRGVLSGLQIVQIFGTTGCDQPVDNSQGGQPEIFATGSPSLSQNSLFLHAGVQVGSLPASLSSPGGPGAVLCWASKTQNAAQMVTCSTGAVTAERCVGEPNGSGLVRVPLTGPFSASDPYLFSCVTPPTVPTFPAIVGCTDAAQTYGIQTDLSFLQAAFAFNGTPLVPGDTVYFQMAYRDLDTGACNGSLVVRWTKSVAIVVTP